MRPINLSMPWVAHHHPSRLRQPHRFMLGLLVLTLLCVVALTNCNDDDGDTLTFRLAIPAHSMNAVGGVSGALKASDVTIVSPPIITNP